MIDHTGFLRLRACGFTFIDSKSEILSYYLKVEGCRIYRVWGGVTAVRNLQITNCNHFLPQKKSYAVQKRQDLCAPHIPVQSTGLPLVLLTDYHKFKRNVIVLKIEKLQKSTMIHVKVPSVQKKSTLYEKSLQKFTRFL